MQYIIIIFLSMFSTMLLFPSAGILDTSFGSSGSVSTSIQTTTLNGQNTACALQQDGKIVVVGNANPGFAIARYVQEGVLDTTFNSTGKVITTTIGSSAAANGVVIDNQGRIVVCGVAGGTFAVARYLSNGALDTVANGGTGFGNATPASATGYVTTTITSSTSSIAYKLIIDANGNILVCGRATISTAYAALARYTSSGVLDTTFGTSSSGMVTSQYSSAASTAYGITVDSSGNILLCGISNSLCFVARYTSVGSLDTTFGTSSSGFIIPSIGTTPTTAYDIVLDSNSKIVICGSTTASSVNKFFVARLLSNGSNFDMAFGSSGYTITAIGTTSIGYSVAMESDGKILVGGITTTGSTNSIFVGRYVSLGVLDTAFNSPTGYNTITLAAATGISRLALQQNNEIVIAATASGSFTTARFIGAAAPQGCMNTTYNSTGVTPGYITDPTDITATHKPEVKALQILSSNSIFVLTEDLATATKSQLVQIDSAGSTTSSNAIAKINIAQTGGADVIVDSHGRALVVGGNGSHGWIARYVPTAAAPGSFAIDTTFNSGSILVQSASPITTAYLRVCEQPSGNILALGQNGSTGIIVAYNQNGTVNTNFGTSGVYSISNITLSDMVVDSSGRIYVIGGIASGDITLYRILANGSGLDSAYNSGSGIDTGFATASYQGAKLAAITTAGIATFVTVNSSTYQFEFKQYSSVGVAGSTLSIAETTHLLTTPTLTQLQIDSNNEPIYVGYSAYSVFAGRLTSALAIDTTFSPYSPLCPGILTTMYNNNNPSRVANCIGIAPSGAIVFGGYENIDSSDTIATIGEIVGNTSYSQIARYPGAEIGQIDTSFGTTGALSLAASPASLAAGSASAMYVLPNNKILVADATGSNTVLGQLTSAYALDTASFGATTGQVTLTGLVLPKNIMIDTLGNIYVVGNGASHAMLFKVTSAGVIAWSITISSLTIGNVVLQQSNGRIIVAGYNGSSGIIAGYNGTTGALDTTFGLSGYYTTGVAEQIAGAAITATDGIVFVYRDVTSGSAIGKRLLANGFVDTTFSFGTALASVSADISSQAQIKLQLDVNGKIIIAARNTTGNFIVHRYLSTGADDVSTQTITLTNPSTSILEQALSLSNGTTLLIGTNTTGNNLEVIRLTSACVLDTNFNYNSGILQTAVSPMTNFYGVDVTSDQGILVAGASATPNPYFTRIFDDYVVTKVNQNTSALGTAGTIDTNFGTSGQVALGGLGSGTPLAGATPLVVLPTSSGSYYIVFDNGALIRLTNNNILDTTFNASGTNNIAGLAANNVPAGTFSMMLDGSSRLVVAGTNGSGHGWIQRYVSGNSGTVDTVANGGIGFNTTGMIDLGASTVATTVVEQTSGRIVVAGKNSSGNGALFGFTNTGVVDTTFGTNGVFDTGIPAGIYGLVCDRYDRLILAIAYTGGGAVYVSRLTSSGQNDLSFGSSYSASLNTINGGAGILQNADIENQVRVALDSAGNIVIAAHQYPAFDVISVTSYDNGTSTTNNSNGNLVAAELDITSLTSPTLTGLMTTSDGNVLLSGSQSAGGSGYNVDMWVARVQNSSGSYILDTNFNPGGANIAQGIMDFSFYGGSNPRILNSIAIYGDGEIAMVGAETSTTPQPFLAMAYDNPYITQIAACPNAKITGTNDITLGASSAASAALGVVFYASATAAANSGQIARAVALQDDAHILVAVDGGLSAGSATPSDIFLKRFTTDGTPDTTFGTTGQQTVLTTYNNQYVKDTVAFTTVAGVHKAILAGYVTNTASGQTSSLLLQYNLDTQALDTGFGGFYGSSAGIACGDGQQINVIGQQSTGRIIAGGLSKDSSPLGLLLGYTVAGKLDTSFGNGGYQSTSSIVGSTGLYTHAIDTQNRIVIAYNNGSNALVVARILADGSALDTSFTVTPSITLQTGVNNNIKVAIDSSNNVVCAAVPSAGNTISVKQYPVAGGAATETALISYTSLGGSSSSVYNLARLLVDAQNNVIVVAYDSFSEKILVMRLVISGASYILDTSFNPNGTPGYILYGVSTGANQVAMDALIHPDGRIIIVGTES